MTHVQDRPTRRGLKSLVVFLWTILRLASGGCYVNELHDCTIQTVEKFNDK